METLSGSMSAIETCVCGCCDVWKCNCDFSRFLDVKKPVPSTSETLSTDLRISSLTSSPVSPMTHKMVLVSDLPKKDKGKTGDVVEAYVTHVETPSDFYVVPKSKFTTRGGSANFFVKEKDVHLRSNSVQIEIRKLRNLSAPSCDHFDVELDRCPKPGDFRYMQYQDMVSNLSCYMYSEFKAYQQLTYLIGEVVVANTIIQGKDVWMRGVVIDVYYSKKDCEHLYEIQLIDYGRTDIVPWNSVTGLPKQFATVQPLAYKCSVGGIMPVLGSMWGCRAIQMFKDLLGGPGKDVLVEMTLLECGKQDKRQWPQVFERKPYIVDINMIDENLNYVSNIAHELSFGSWNTTCAVPTGTIPWFSRLNLWWGKKWKRDGWNY